MVQGVHVGWGGGGGGGGKILLGCFEGVASYI